MTDKTAQPEAAASDTTAPAQPDTAPWRARVDHDLNLNTNPFERFDPSGNSASSDAAVNPRMTIQDASVDTAPLQGSKDLSDDDHLG